MRITFARACRLAAPLAAALLVPALSAAPVEAETRDVEKPHLKLGFIKLTDVAPLAIAYEKGFFEDEGGVGLAASLLVSAGGGLLYRLAPRLPYIGATAPHKGNDDEPYFHH